MKWHNIADGDLPGFGKEVLVWIDGHRGPAWRNHYALVAYREANGEFYEERHFNDGPLIGVEKWAEISIPE